MASTQTPLAFVQNENVHIHRGKAGDAGKIAANERPSLNRKKKGLGERRALADLSKAGNPLPPKPRDTAPKTRIPPKTRQPPPPAAATKPTPLTDALLTDEDIRNCQEWAKEGIEHLHFSSNDLHKLEADAQRERVNKEVDMVMSSLRSWRETGYGLCLPPSEASIDTEPISRLELEPEITLPNETTFSSISDDEELDGLLKAELSEFHSFDDDDFMFKLKDTEDEASSSDEKGVLLPMYV